MLDDLNFGSWDPSAFVELNPSASRTLILVHGWPGLWSNWANQIVEFEQDYHLLVPDVRGFGGSSHPGDVESSGTMGDFVGDLACILEDRKVSKAVCVGYVMNNCAYSALILGTSHDWGSQICWEAARMRPDLFEAAVGVVVPVSRHLVSATWTFDTYSFLKVHCLSGTFHACRATHTALKDS